jgi:ABC-type lipoprotein release transport system permease subunit
MRQLIDIAGTGLVAIILHPLRSAVVLLTLVVVLLPFLVGIALARGLERDAEESIRFGADFYVTGTQFGRSVPLPRDEAIRRIRAIPGVDDVVPRCMGTVILGDDTRAVLVGMPPDHFPPWASCIEGRLPKDGTPHELVIGTDLAHELGLKVGAIIPPFYRNEKQGERTSRIVGIFRPQTSLWQAHLILTTLETGCFVFGQPDRITDLLVSCSPGLASDVSSALHHLGNFSDSEGTHAVGVRVTSREDLVALLPGGLLRMESIFSLHFLLAFVVAILVLLVTTGLGLTERRREIGILKATGWQTDQIIFRGVVESAALSFGGAGLAFLLSWVWLRFFNAWGIAGIFLSGTPLNPNFAIPFRLTPVPLLLAFAISFAVVLSGTVYSSWRAAVVHPRVAMR